MKRKFKKYLLVILLICITPKYKAQSLSLCQKIFPFVSYQVSTDDTIISITNDAARLNDPNKFYSMFYIKNKIPVDSISLDAYSNSGAKPKDLFFWNTKDGEKILCIEYYEGSGVGHIIIDETNLLLFDMDNNKLNLLSSFGTDSAFYNSRRNKYSNINSRIYQDGDTLYIARRGWDSQEVKGREIKVNTFNKLTKIIWANSKLKVMLTNTPPYFYYKGW